MLDEANLPPKYFVRNYAFILAFIIPTTLLGIFLLAVFTIPLIISINTGLELAQHEIWAAIALNILVFGSVLYPLFISYTESSLIFTEKSIAKKWLFGEKKLLWSEVVSVYTIGPRLTIKTNDKRLSVNLNYFRDPDELIIFIRDHIDLNTDAS
jgi:hypothetical protein